MALFYFDDLGLSCLTVGLSSMNTDKICRTHFIGLDATRHFLALGFGRRLSSVFSGRSLIGFGELIRCGL